MAFIEAEHLIHRFTRKDEEGNVIAEVQALDGIELSVEAGQFVAILGQNGSGKSTFARHINALLAPTDGTLFVDGKDTKDEDVMWEIRRAAGMIFQNPDNQIVAAVVEEDVAFGPENLGVPSDEIVQRVDESLEAVGMADYRRHSPEKLSGGQKQRVAAAGVLAMQTKCIVMDEATAMLDPAGRREVMETAHRLNREKGVTVILITHFMEEAAEADVVFVLDRGKVVMRGTPREVFSKAERLPEYGLCLPRITCLANMLRRDGLSLPEVILTVEELADALCEGNLINPDARIVKGDYENADGKGGCREIGGLIGEEKENDDGHIDDSEAGMIPGVRDKGKEKLCLQHVSYTYSPGKTYETRALQDVNLTIREGELIGLIGPTGSGKSTLIQLLNGLLTPTEGHVFFEGRDIHAPGEGRSDPSGKRHRRKTDKSANPGSATGISGKELRGRVGLVFQFAESQLFETTVLRDVAYGPKNFGLDEDEAEERAREALRQVGLGEESWEMSPFDLSGGQRRRAAIAGVLAMEPSVLILDEPTAGLDPRGREELFSLIRRLHGETHITVVIVSHNMEDMADLADRIVVLNGGKIMLDGTPDQVFAHVSKLEAASLAVPEVTGLMMELKRRGFPVSAAVTTLDEAEREIIAVRAHDTHPAPDSSGRLNARKL